MQTIPNDPLPAQVNEDDHCELLPTEVEEEQAARPEASRAVTPGSLADQINRAISGQDPSWFFFSDAF